MSIRGGLMVLMVLAACSKEAAAPSGAAAQPAAAALATVDASGTVLTVVPEGAQAAVGQEAVVHVHVQPAAGFHMNTDGFPHGLKVTVPDGVACDKSELADTDAKIAADGLDWPLRYKLTAAGEKELAATATIGICNDSGCVPKTIQVAWKSGAR